LARSEDGIHFLVGDRDSITFLADECGFRYKYVPRQKLYSHLPCFILLSPTGKIVRYIHGIDYDPITMKRALVEASEGRIGSPINRLSYSLGCYLFDESTGKYSPQAMVFMRLGGAITVGLLLITLVPYWFFRRGTKPGKSHSESNDKRIHPSTL
jgi:protein SCO1/2